MNKKTTFLSSLLISAIILAFSSCTKEPTASFYKELPKSVRLSDIPFASQAELDQWQGDADIIYYRTARMLTMIEMGYSSHQILDRPVILYDFDSTPRYYEFILLSGDGKPNGTICTYARKEQPAVVAFMLPFLRDYQTLGVKSLGLNTFVCNCPDQLYYGLPTRQGASPHYLFNAEGGVEPEIPPVQYLLDPIAQMDALDAHYFEILGVERLAQKAAVAEALHLEKEAATVYWEQVALIEEALIAQEKAGWVQTKATTTRIDEFILPQYDTEPMQKTRWSGGCGPSALANMYRGLYDHYKGVHLPLWGDDDFLQKKAEGRIHLGQRAIYFYKDLGDANGDGVINLVDRSWIEPRSACTDNGLYADICDYGWYYFVSRIPLAPDWGAAFPINLTQALERITNNEYTLSILPTLCPHQHIRTQGLSVILLNTQFSHFLHAYGSREQYWKWETVFKLFGKEVRIDAPEIVTHRWFKVNDSGTDMSKHNMLPFWADDCITNFIFRFAVSKK